MTKRPNPGGLQHDPARELVFDSQVRPVDVRISKVRQDYTGEKSSVSIVRIPACNITGKSPKAGTCRTVPHVRGRPGVGGRRAVQGSEDTGVRVLRTNQV